MSKFLKYNFKKYNKEDYNKFLSRALSNNIEGVIFSLHDSKAKFLKGNYEEEFIDEISDMLVLAHERCMKTAIEIDIFHSPYLWQHKNFSPPISSKGTEYLPTNGYYPICPNNKLSGERFAKLIEHVSNFIPDYFILSEFRFPYHWKENALDLQDKIPPFCYCPFCIGEFSSELGIVITDLNSLYDNINQWMNWRFEVLDDYFDYIMDKLVAKKAVVIQVPPLNLVDIPFSTGQVLLDYGEHGAKVSPMLFHRTKGKDAYWGLDVLDVFRIDIPKEIILPSIEVINKKNPSQIFPAYNEYEDIFIY